MTWGIINSEVKKLLTGSNNSNNGYNGNNNNNNLHEKSLKSSEFEEK